MRCGTCGSERTSMWRLVAHRDPGLPMKVCWKWHCHCGVGRIDYKAEINLGDLQDKVEKAMRVAEAMDKEWGGSGHLKMMLLAALADAMNRGVDQAVQDSESVQAEY